MCYIHDLIHVFTGNHSALRINDSWVRWNGLFVREYALCLLCMKLAEAPPFHRYATRLGLWGASPTVLCRRVWAPPAALHQSHSSEVSREWREMTGKGRKCPWFYLRPWPPRPKMFPVGSSAWQRQRSSWSMGGNPGVIGWVDDQGRTEYAFFSQDTTVTVLRGIA